MADLDSLLLRLDRRRRLQRMLDAAAPRLLAASLIAATAIATVRLALPSVAWAVPACVAAGLIIPLAWLPAAWRRRDGRARLAGELDLLAGSHGTAMALAETPDAAWSPRLAPFLARVVLPPLRLRPLLPAVACAALLLAAPALPQAVPAAPVAHPATALVRPVREELASLAEAKVITPEERVELEKRLDDLLARSGGGLPDQATWEGIDRLQAHLDAQAVAAGEKLAAALAAAQDGAERQPQEGAQAAQLAESLVQAAAALAQQAPGLVPADLGDPQAQQAFAQALAQTQAKGLISEAQRAALEKAGFKPGKPGAASASQARALARRLADELQKRKQGLGQGRAATAAEAFLARLRAGQGETPGSGSPTRGPGTAEITKEGRARTAGGEQEGLAPGATLNPDGSVTVAAQARDAEADPAAREALQRAAARAFDPAAADSRRATVAPRHRAAVEGYFSGK